MKKFKNTNIEIEVSDFCHDFIYWHNIFKPKISDRKANQVWISYLRRFRKHLKERLKFDNEDFLFFENQLNKFNLVNDSNDLRVISEYLLNVMGATKLWDKKEIYLKLKRSILP